jgi:hypothetical protein
MQRRGEHVYVCIQDMCWMQASAAYDQASALLALCDHGGGLVVERPLPYMHGRRLLSRTAARLRLHIIRSHCNTNQ